MSRPADREAWLAAGTALAASRSDRAWELADWLVEGETAFGRPAVREGAAGLGIDPGRVSHHLRTAKAFPPATRHAGLPFGFHQEVARLPAPGAARLLDAAAGEGWSRQELREAAREEGTAARLLRARDEIARLREENERLRTDAQTARAEARRVEHGVAAAARAVVAAYQAAAEAIEGFAAGTACPALHGNARPAVRQRIEQVLARAVARAARIVEERIAPALDRIERGEPR